MSLATREVPPPPPPQSGYAETPNQERSIALLPGISLAGDAGPDGRQGSGFVEAVGDPTADDALSWHVQKIKERQKDVDGTEEDVKKRARATVETAAAAAAAAAATSAGEVLKDRRSPRRQGRMGTSDRTHLRFTRGVHQRGHPSRARTLDRIRASVQQRLDALHVPGAARERHRGASRDVAAVVEERHLLLPGVHPSLLRGFFFSLRGVLYERTSGWS